MKQGTLPFPKPKREKRVNLNLNERHVLIHVMSNTGTMLTASVLARTVARLIQKKLLDAEGKITEAGRQWYARRRV